MPLQAYIIIAAISQVVRAAVSSSECGAICGWDDEGHCEHTRRRRNTWSSSMTSLPVLSTTKRESTSIGRRMARNQTALSVTAATIATESLHNYCSLSSCL